MEKTIYKKDSSGKVRYLTISTEGATLTQESGVVGTPNPVYNVSVSTPKNVGRANETSGEEQAVLEAESKLTLKLRQGYFKTKEQAMAEGGKDFLLPMLAKDFKKESKKVQYPCYAQPKLDGCRALGVDGDRLVSRTGKIFENINHIILPNEDDIFDGELYSFGISFQENMKLIKKYRKGETEKIKYHVYDLVSDLPFIDRYHKLIELVDGNDAIELVETILINNEAELKEFHSINIEKGYEGTIVRHSNVGYEVNKRSSQLLKYKDFLDESYLVIDVIPSDVRPEQGIVVCQTPYGTTFNCGMKFSHKEREEILINKEQYIGKLGEVRFFEYTDGGLPRFPVCHGFRID